MRFAMRFAILLAVVLSAPAQTLPTGFLRGILVQSQPGEFFVRSPANVIYRFSSDNRTWIEREKERIPVTNLMRGEVVEVVSDRDIYGALPIHYARMVQVITKVNELSKVRDGKYRLHKPQEKQFENVRNFTYSGIVIRITAGSLLLRTRLDGEHVIYLDPQTRWFENGLEVDARSLRPYTFVSVEGDRDKDSQIEALHVVWGSILEAAGSPR